MAFLPGKFARFRSASANVTGAYKWSPSFKRERLDTTNFESVVSSSGNNVHTEGTTGPLDTTFSVEGWATDANVNTFFPEAALTCDLLYRKSSSLGYMGVVADVLDFGPSTAAREMARFTANLQASGLVSPAA